MLGRHNRVGWLLDEDQCHSARCVLVVTSGSAAMMKLYF